MNNYEMAGLIALVVLFLLSTIPAAAEANYCAFEVRVSRPSGTPVAKVPVYLIRHEHTTLSETTTNASGIASLCDASLGPVDIGVGFDVCGSVLVRDLKATWPVVRQVFVTYMETPCEHFVFGDGCQVLLRIQDEHGRPIAGARFDGKYSAASGDASDAFGRLFRLIKTGEKLEGMVRKEGHEPTRISESCLKRGERDIELKVFLRER